MLTSTDILTAAKNGIKETTFRQRLARGWDKERAATEPVNQRQKDLTKWHQIAKQNGICKKSFDNRVYRLYWTEERAATEPVKKRIGGGNSDHC